MSVYFSNGVDEIRPDKLPRGNVYQRLERLQTKVHGRKGIRWLHGMRKKCKKLGHEGEKIKLEDGWLT